MSTSMSTIKILIVDDNQENLERAKKEFSGRNVKLTCCSLFSVAADLLHERSYDVLLTDLMLPGEPNGIGEENAEIGKDTPYGLVLAIMARNKGMKNVAILTDISHHSGPIAWAMDRLLFGTQSDIRCFDSKDWLAVANKFIPIVYNCGSDEILVSKMKKTLMLVGINDVYKRILQEQLQKKFNVIIIPEKNIKEVPIAFVEKQPDFIFLIGEINERMKGQGAVFDVRNLYRTLISLKTSGQRVIVAGFLESSDPNYMQSPFHVNDLLAKLSAK